MPAKSIKQQRFMGMVHAAQKKGGKAASPEVAKVAKSIKKGDAKKFASTKHKGLPTKVKSEGLREAKDETMRHGDKGRPPSGYDKSSWDWKIHSNGSYWKSDGQWGARAKSGQVDYFVSKITSMRFADYTHKGGPASYVQGNFMKGKTEDRKITSRNRTEGVQKIREYVRSMVREVLVERRKVRKEAYDPGAEGERAGKLDNLAAKSGIKIRKGESRDDFEDRVSVATEGVIEGGPGSGPHRTGSLARGSRNKGGDNARMKGDVWVDRKWGDRKYAAKNNQGKVLHFGSRPSAARFATK